jgi:hypothetical protein
MKHEDDLVRINQMGPNLSQIYMVHILTLFF